MELPVVGLAFLFPLNTGDLKKKGKSLFFQLPRLPARVRSTDCPTGDLNLPGNEISSRARWFASNPPKEGES